MGNEFDTSEVKQLRIRLLELERENEKLHSEVSLYLGKWVSALDLASFRQVLMLAKDVKQKINNETPTCCFPCSSIRDDGESCRDS